MNRPERTIYRLRVRRVETETFKTVHVSYLSARKDGNSYYLVPIGTGENVSYENVREFRHLGDARRALKLIAIKSAIVARRFQVPNGVHHFDRTWIKVIGLAEIVQVTLFEAEATVVTRDEGGHPLLQLARAIL